MIPYQLIHTIGDAHVYNNHFKQMQKQLQRIPYEPPQLLLNDFILSLDRFTIDDIKLSDYGSHGAIYLPMTL